ncbi:MAG: ABC transporter ATP-binding protein [Thermoplasmata archaeon]
MNVRLKSVEKYYGKFRALGAINLEINDPGIITILGPNGAGKTTMLKVMTGLSKPKKGIVEIDGNNIFEDRKKVLMKMGTLVEQPEFYTYIKGREILSFSASLKGISGEEMKAEIERVVAATGSNDFLDKKVGKYSRGMKQRLGIATALIGDPEILILDEPTFGIDPMGSLEIRELIKNLNSKKEKIIIFTTHVIEEAIKLSDRIIILNNGLIEYDASNGGEYTLLKISGEIGDIPPGYKYTRISENEYIFEVREEEIPEFNRKITKAGNIKYIEKSSMVEETIRKISIKNLKNS